MGHLEQFVAQLIPAQRTSSLPPLDGYGDFPNPNCMEPGKATRGSPGRNALLEDNPDGRTRGLLMGIERWCSS